MRRSVSLQHHLKRPPCDSAGDAWSQAAECFSDAGGRVDGASHSLDAHEAWKEAAESLKMQAAAEEWRDEATVRGMLAPAHEEALTE